MDAEAGPSLQERYAPANACWGCGPSNADGLRIRSFVAGDEVVADWKPEPKYEAFPGVLNGGIIGTLLDCHCNWTAANHLMKQAGEDHPPCTVTADYAIKLLRPTPTHDSDSSLRPGGGIDRRSRHDRRHSHRRRQSLRDLPWDVCRGQGRASRLSPLVGGCR